jgi:hypothetical protein
MWGNRIGGSRARSGGAVHRLSESAVMRGKRNLCVPSGSGRYGFDLVIGDLVAPHGTGEHVDSYFFSEPPSEDADGGRCDLVFPAPEDGIQRWDVLAVEGLQASTYRFRYPVPAGSIVEAGELGDVQEVCIA